jgi:hypothetical protein
VQTAPVVEHATGGPNAQHPLFPKVHATWPPETHDICPFVQAFVQQAPLLHAPFVQADEDAS